MKIIKFQQEERIEVVAANEVLEGVTYYFHELQDDGTIEQMVSKGMVIKELDEEELQEKVVLYNEDNDEYEKITYQELAERHFDGEAILIYPEL